MQTFKTGAMFQPITKAQFVATSGRTRFTVRCEARTLAYFSDLEDFTDEILAGAAEVGEFEMTVPRGYVRFQSSKRVWIDNNQLNQTVEKMSDEIFTTLDRPAALSPEMLAIQRLARQNEIEREFYRAQLGAIQNETQRNDSRAESAGDAPEGEADAEDVLREEPSGSEGDIDQPKDETADKQANTDKVRPKAKSRGSSSTEGD